MPILRVTLTILYASYLVNVGMLLMLAPWSDAWSQFLLLIPVRAAVILDHPAVRGMVSAFGFLHLVMLAAELLFPDGGLTESKSRDLM